MIKKMKRFFLILLTASVLCPVVRGDSKNNNQNVIYHGYHAAALLDDSSQECVDYITASSEDFVFMRAAFDAEIRRQLLSGCSSFNSNHSYTPCRQPDAFTSLMKPYLDSFQEVSGDARNILYLAAFQNICHNQPLIWPEGNATAISLYRIISNKTAYHASVANQPKWVTYGVFGGLFLAFGFIVLFDER